MHAKCQRTVFYFISKGELHLITVVIMIGTFLNSFKYIFITKIPDCAIQQLFYLGFFQVKLLLIREILIGTSTAVGKMRT